jgi:sulfatase modifying factor 1
MNLPEKYTHHLPNGTYFDLILVKAGSFIMGSEGANAVSAENPEHIVQLTDDYYMSEYPVTQEVWEAVSKYGLPKQTFTGGKRPITNVSWIDIFEGNQKENGQDSFLKQLNATPFSADVQSLFTDLNLSFNLPTEAQWEYAAKGGHLSPQENLEDTTTEALYTPYSGSKKLKEVAWFGTNSHQETKNVGQKKANELGLYDMTGNVWEWCYDWFSSDFYKKSKEENMVNPFNSQDGSGRFRVIRGGSWRFAPQSCRVSYRYSSLPSSRVNFIGFRLVLSSFSLAVS